MTVRREDAIDGDLLVGVSSGHHTPPVYIGTVRLRTWRDLAPNPMVGVDRVGERRELRQVIQLSDAFRSRHQVAPVLPLHAVAGLMEFPDSSFLALAVIHRGALSRSGSHRAGEAGTVRWMGTPHHDLRWRFVIVPVAFVQAGSRRLGR
jgi:hypothetical protein